MHGRNTLSKRLSKLDRKSTPVRQVSSISIGDWRLTENEDGDLLITNQVSGSSIILARK